MNRKRLFAAVVGIVIVAAGAYGAYRMRSAPQECPGPVPTVEPAKKPHLPIAAIRDKLLTAFHGEAAHQFTEIPGFGFERMTPLYKKIPFELPYFSTGELEVVGAPEKTPHDLNDALVAGIATFQGKPLEARPASQLVPFGDPKAPGYGFAMGGTVTHGLQLRHFDLVGLTDPSQPKVYSGGKAFELIRYTKEEVEKFAKNAPTNIAWNRMVAEIPTTEQKSETAEPEMRSLDMFEAAGIPDLLQGKNVFIRSKDRVVRMLGALRAGADCLKCHSEAKAGDLLGAFSYTFVDTHGSLAAELKSAAK
jgi:hypothetical protein